MRIFTVIDLLLCLAIVGTANAQWREAGKISSIDDSTCKDRDDLDLYFAQTLTLAGFCEDSYSIQLQNDPNFERRLAVQYVRKSTDAYAARPTSIIHS